MDTKPIDTSRLAASVVAVPPLARDKELKVSREENKKLIDFIEQGGVDILLYGGNAVFYHVRMSEYAEILQMLVELAGEKTLVIPSVGPAFGTMMDQAEILKEFNFPTAMVLPQRDIADASGLEAGICRFAEAFGKPVVLYLKHDRWLPPKVVGKMVSRGMISWVKYAVVREDAAQDDYLREVLNEVPGEIVVSGIGEQPAITHLRDFGVVGFTSGCVCVNPAKSMQMLKAIQDQDFERAEELRLHFCGLEDLRNEINPIRVLHRGVALGGIADTGPMYPMLGELDSEQEKLVADAALGLKAMD